MNPTKLLDAMTDSELRDIATTLPDIFERRGLELPVLLGATAITERTGLKRNKRSWEQGVPSWESSIDTLPDKLRETAQATRTALADKYKRPVTDFSLVTTNISNGDNVEAKTVVVLSSTNGIDLAKTSDTYHDLRKWNHVNPDIDNQDFMVKVEGVEADERLGLTLEVMQVLATHNNIIDERIWETGRPDLYTPPIEAPILYVGNGQVTRSVDLPGRDNIGIVYRPAVIIE